MGNQNAAFPPGWLITILPPMATRMQVVYPSLGAMELRETSEPALPERGALLRTRYSALSPGTERNQLIGGNYNQNFPATPGCQTLSEVVVVADGSPWRVGQLLITGTSGTHAQTHVIGPEALAAEVPDTADLTAAPYCSLAAVGWHDAQRAGAATGRTTLVIGDGVLGIFCAQSARLLGSRVGLLGSHDDRLAMARVCGIERILNRNTTEVATIDPVHVVIETAGADLDPIIDTGFGGKALLVREGRLMMTAGRERVTYDSNAAQFRRLTIVHSAHYDLVHLQTVARLWLEGRLLIRPLITRTVPWRDTPAIYAQLRDRPRELFGTIIDWTTA